MPSFQDVRDEEVRRLVERVAGGDAIGASAAVREVRLSEILYEYADDVVCHVAMGRRRGRVGRQHGTRR